MAHAPVHSYLATRFGSEPFDSIIDAVGVQEVFTHCAAYLAPGRPFVTVGVMMRSLSYMSFFSAAYCIVKNLYWPRMLWGTPRVFVMISMMEPERAMLEKLKDFVETGKVRAEVDSCWEMANALKVSSRIGFSG